jgi:hypothetical protein
MGVDVRARGSGIERRVPRRKVRRAAPGSRRDSPAWPRRLESITPMVAQSEDSAVAAITILFALALLGLQIYLIYAIIATRADVKAIRRRLQPEFGSPSSAFQEIGSPPPVAGRTEPQAASGPVYAVHLLWPGRDPFGVVQVLVSQTGLRPD